MKHNKLKRHLEARHSGLVNKERSHFERQEQKPKKPRLDSPTNSVVILVQQATLTSYLVAWRIARAKKANNIGEELVKPAALYMVRTIYRNKFAEKLENVPLSNDTVHKRNQSMSCYIKDQVIAAIKKSWHLSLRLD